MTDLSTSPTTRSVRLVPFDDLTVDEMNAWFELRASNPALDSPYFHPGFAAAVHKGGQPVSVVVSRGRDGRVTALLPTHRNGAHLVPAGWPGADFQGPIAAPESLDAPLDLLPDTIRQARFDHLVSPGAAFDPFIVARHPAPFIDTTGGLDGYLGRASRAGRENMSQARRRTAKAERQFGPVTFGADVVDEDVLGRVISLKRAQYAATGVRDYFATSGRIELMSRLLHTRQPDFAGILSTVHVGGHLLAAHFGIRSERVLHWWFPVYDPEYSQLAPGWILLRELVDAAPALGVHRIDLGRGDDEYKRRAKTGETVVCEATLTRSAARRMARQVRHNVGTFAKSSAFAPALRPIIRRLRTGRTKGTDQQGGTP